MLFRTFGAGLCGTEGFPVCCEADVENGFPQINFIGSLSQSVRESSDRVRTAIANTGLHLEPRHVTISLSPGDVRKEGCAYDLPVAAALLGAYGICRILSRKTRFWSESFPSAGRSFRSTASSPWSALPGTQD